jgi:hypothetical protein
VLLTWKNVTNVSWRHLTQHHITRDADREICRISGEFNNNIQILERKNTALQLELEEVRQSIENERKTMKNMFLRYVPKNAITSQPHIYHYNNLMF